MQQIIINEKTREPIMLFNDTKMQSGDFITVNGREYLVIKRVIDIDKDTICIYAAEKVKPASR